MASHSISGASSHQSKLDQAGRLLAATTLLLVMTGLIMVYAASALKGEQQFNDAFVFLRKQAFVALGGLVAMATISKLPMRVVERLALPLLVFALGILALIFVPGVYKSGGGAARWISLGGFRFQSSEIAKLALVFFLAKNMSRKGFDINQVKGGLAQNFIVFGLFAALMMRQPDFGSTALMGLVLVGMLFVAGLNWRYIAGAIGAAVLAAAPMAPAI